MSYGDFEASIISIFVPILVAISFWSSTIILTVRLTTAQPVAGYIPFILAFGFLGGISGLIAGYSRESIAGILLTGLLGLISALLSHMFSKESLAKWRPYIPYCIILLVLSALTGLTIGGISKKEWNAQDIVNKRADLHFEKVDLEVEKERKILEIRARYGARKAD